MPHMARVGHDVTAWRLRCWIDRHLLGQRSNATSSRSFTLDRSAVSRRLRRSTSSRRVTGLIRENAHRAAVLRIRAGWRELLEPLRNRVICVRVLLTCGDALLDADATPQVVQIDA